MHRVHAVKLVRPAFLRWLGVLVRRLVVAVGVKCEHIRVGRVGSASAARGHFGSLDLHGRGGAV